MTRLRFFAYEGCVYGSHRRSKMRRPRTLNHGISSCRYAVRNDVSSDGDYVAGLEAGFASIQLRLFESLHL